MQFLGLLGKYFDAVAVDVKTFLLLFRLTLAILCCAIILVHEQIPDSFLVRSQWIRFQIESALRMPAHKIDNLMVCLLSGSTFNSPCID